MAPLYAIQLVLQRLPVCRVAKQPFCLEIELFGALQRIAGGLFGGDPGGERLETLRVLLTTLSIVGVERLELAHNDVPHVGLARERG
jgi:hypothetical protein